MAQSGFTSLIYDWDEAKRQANLAKHGVDFRDVQFPDWDSARVRQDHRSDYGELRFNAAIYLFGRLHALTFTLRSPQTLRVISFRKANDRELKQYLGDGS